MKGKEVQIYSTSMEIAQQLPPKTSFCHINKEMIRFKAHFFLFIGGMGSVLPYVSVVAKHRLGLSASSLATVVTVSQLITILSKPVMGYLADYFNRLKLMINTLLVIQTVVYFLLLAIPPINDPPISISFSEFSDKIFLNKTDQTNYVILTIKPDVPCENLYNYSMLHITTESLITIEQIYDNNLVCLSQFNKTLLNCYQEHIPNNFYNANVFQTVKNSCCKISYLKSNSTNKNPKNNSSSINLLGIGNHFSVQYNDNKMSLCSVKFPNFNSSNSHQSNKSDFATTGFWLFAIVFILIIVCGNSIFTLGDTACCESVEKHKGEFGRQRLFGAIGWGIIAPIGGLLCDVTGDFLAAWILMAVLQCFALWNICKIDLVKPNYSQNILKDVGTVLKSAKFLTVELGVFINGMGAGTMWYYLVLYLMSLGSSKFLLGMVQYVQCFAGEIPFMFFSGWFIKKLGHYNLISLSLLCYAIRFLWYSYIQNPWLVLPMEIIHGFTYGTFFPTIANYGKITAKPGTEATTLSILFSTHDGLGAGLGCVIAGLSFDYFGGQKAFFYGSIFFFCAAALNMFNTFLLIRKKTKVFSLTETKTPI